MKKLLSMLLLCCLSATAADITLTGTGTFVFTSNNNAVVMGATGGSVSIGGDAKLGVASGVMYVQTNGVAAGDFDYNAVSFAGGDYMTNAAVPAAADSKNGVVSLWFRVASHAGETLLQFGGMKLRFFNPELGIQGVNPGGDMVLRAYEASPNISDDAWHHVMLTWGLNGATNQMRMYVDGSEVALAAKIDTDAAVDFTTGNNPGSGVAANQDGTAASSADLCEVFFATPGSYYNPGDTLAFRTAGGKPENLGADGSTPTGSQPLVYLKGVYTAYHGNSGSAASYTVTGTLSTTDAP